MVLQNERQVNLLPVIRMLRVYDPTALSGEAFPHGPPTAKKQSTFESSALIQMASDQYVCIGVDTTLELSH